MHVCMFLWRHPGHTQGLMYVDMCHTHSATFCFLDSTSQLVTLPQAAPQHEGGGEVWWLGGQAVRLSLDSALHSLCILGQVT